MAPGAEKTLAASAEISYPLAMPRALLFARVTEALFDRKR
jgi:hypothetical protein